MIPATFLEKRLSMDYDRVSLGYMEVYLYDIEELEEVQLPYQLDPEGKLRASHEPGAWQVNWLVVGMEDLCGDPLFIDTSDDRFPVFSAASGEVEWEAVQIADSWDGFAYALQLVQVLSIGRENPERFEKNPIPPNVYIQHLDEIATHNPQADMTFWENWLIEN